jgi:hypothetical protein
MGQAGIVLDRGAAVHRPARAEVCSGSFAPIPRCPSYVRLCFKSGDKADIAGAQLSTPISPNGRYGISSPLKLPHWRLDARDLYNPVPLRRLGGDVGFERGRSGHATRIARSLAISGSSTSRDCHRQGHREVRVPSRGQGPVTCRGCGNRSGIGSAERNFGSSLRRISERSDPPSFIKPRPTSRRNRREILLHCEAPGDLAGGLVMRGAQIRRQRRRRGSLSVMFAPQHRKVPKFPISTADRCRPPAGVSMR